MTAPPRAGCAACGARATGAPRARGRPETFAPDARARTARGAGGPLGPRGGRRRAQNFGKSQNRDLETKILHKERYL